MAAVLAELCGRGNQLAAEARTTEAAKAYSSLLAKEPPTGYAHTCAVVGLKGIVPTNSPTTKTVTAVGPQGPPGPPGMNGTPGINGTNGTNGKSSTTIVFCRRTKGCGWAG
jgi:hypothetical protein